MRGLRRRKLPAAQCAASSTAGESAGDTSCRDSQTSCEHAEAAAAPAAAKSGASNPYCSESTGYTQLAGKRAGCKNVRGGETHYNRPRHSEE